MAWRRTGAKPLNKLMMTCNQLCSWKLNSVYFESQCIHFPFKKNFENVVCKMSAILFRIQYTPMSRYRHSLVLWGLSASSTHSRTRSRRPFWITASDKRHFILNYWGFQGRFPENISVCLVRIVPADGAIRREVLSQSSHTHCSNQFWDGTWRDRHFKVFFKVNQAIFIDVSMVSLLTSIFSFGHMRLSPWIALNNQ